MMPYKNVSFHVGEYIANMVKTEWRALFVVQFVDIDIDFVQK